MKLVGKVVTTSLTDNQYCMAQLHENQSHHTVKIDAVTA
jgi:hypothetical protein